MVVFNSSEIQYMDMETITTISFGVSAVSLFILGQIMFYQRAYGRGYAHGRHSGFSEGLWKAAERHSKRTEKTKFLVR